MALKDMSETKRLIIAMLLITAVFFGWAKLQPAPKKIAPVVSANGTIATSIPAAPTKIVTPTEVAIPVAPQFTELSGIDYKMETPLYKAILNSDGALKSFELKKYSLEANSTADFVNLVHPAVAPSGVLLLTWNGQPVTKGWQAEVGNLTVNANSSGSIKLSTNVGNVKIIRDFSFFGNNYLIDEKTTVINQGNASITGLLGVTISTADLHVKPTEPLLIPVNDKYNIMQVRYLENGKMTHENQGSKVLKAGFDAPSDLSWVSIGNNYFSEGIIPLTGNSSAGAKWLPSGVFQASVGQNIVLAAGKETVVHLNYYMGPKHKVDLIKAPNDFSNSLDYGFLDVISKPLMAILNFFYNFTHNYGIAIILLTVLVRAALWPLAQKSYKSMAQMRKIQPLMKKIRERYKDDKQMQQKEMMKLYKTYNVNPMGGCLPMVAQLPIFVALYEGLLGSIELRHAVFIPHIPFTHIPWLLDLAVKDPFYITPILMGITMFLQQKMTPAAGDPTQAKVMMFLPVIFTFLFMGFPAGLVIYWLTNNLLSIFQQWLLMGRKQNA